MKKLSGEKLKRIAQVAIVVKNIEEARDFWAELLGMEKNPIIETEGWKLSHMTFRGAPSNGKAKITFFNLENIALELIQPVGGPSTWQDFLEKHSEGIHHIAFNIENLDEMLKRFAKMEIGVEQKGDFEGGCYVYMNSKSKLGAIIELLHHT